MRRGEILGIYGLIGSGRSEVMQALFGLTRADAGHLSLDGRRIAINSPAAAIREGLAYVPEDRQVQGAVLGLPIRDNMALPSLARPRHGRFRQLPHAKLRAPTTGLRVST